MKEGVKVDIESLVSKAKKGDKEALLELIMTKKNEYYRLAFVYLRNEEDSLDAISDMIIILYEKIYQLKNKKIFYSWSKTILVNCCKKILKEKGRIIPVETIEDKGYEGEMANKDNQMLIEDHLSKLKEIHQDVIKLRYFLDLDYKTISWILKIPVGTVKSRISFGLQNLKKSLGGDDFEIR